MSECGAAEEQEPANGLGCGQEAIGPAEAVLDTLDQSHGVEVAVTADDGQKEGKQASTALPVEAFRIFETATFECRNIQNDK